MILGYLNDLAVTPRIVLHVDIRLYLAHRVSLLKHIAKRLMLLDAQHITLILNLEC